MASNRIPWTGVLKDPDDQESIAQLVRLLEYRNQVGTAAPTSDTPGANGSMYIKLGATTSDALTLYVKYNNEWYGG